MNLDLSTAVRTASAIRFDLALQPPGGSTAKIFPPTYPTPKDAGRNEARTGYATETRLLGNEQVTAVLLDSIPSQANRLEQALLDARRSDPVQVQFPLIEVKVNEDTTLTDLDVPHRVYDAILLDSHLDGQPFPTSSIGRQLASATPRNATALFTYAPTALIFGAWNSHAGQRIGMAKFPRCVTSEIIGWPVVRGVKTASRIDPLGITKSAGEGMYEAEAGRWTFDKERARKENNKPKATKPSEMGHGNVAPSIDRDTGGISVQSVRQIAVLSLAQLRLFHFLTSDGTSDPERDHAARTVLAALALVALLEQWERGYQLRSGCLLQPVSEPTWTLCGRTAREDTTFDLSGNEARQLLKAVQATAEQHGLRWPSTPIKLTASPDLQQLVKRNSEMLASTSEEE